VNEVDPLALHDRHRFSTPPAQFELRYGEGDGAERDGDGSGDGEWAGPASASKSSVAKASSNSTLPQSNCERAIARGLVKRQSGRC
jgi:hypothetical protein